jgi:hypothetical protein
MQGHGFSQPLETDGAGVVGQAQPISIIGHIMTDEYF